MAISTSRCDRPGWDDMTMPSTYTPLMCRMAERSPSSPHTCRTSSVSASTKASTKFFSVARISSHHFAESLAFNPHFDATFNADFNAAPSSSVLMCGMAASIIVPTRKGRDNCLDTTMSSLPSPAKSSANPGEATRSSEMRTMACCANCASDSGDPNACVCSMAPKTRSDAIYESAASARHSSQVVKKGFSASGVAVVSVVVCSSNLSSAFCTAEP
mmetsp:Transcript_30556/g.56047  ORF Transcript_30556/g.56047 Transcript_30556/m.56047 type:complete len:216 (-) Transcript_30556:332-979(-)